MPTNRNITGKPRPIKHGRKLTFEVDAPLNPNHHHPIKHAFFSSRPFPLHYSDHVLIGYQNFRDSVAEELAGCKLR